VVMANRPGRILRDLEVLLPRPRDPDDEQLVEMSRHIREELRQAELAGLPAETPSARTSSARERPMNGNVPGPAENDMPRRVVGPVGARR